MQWAVFIDRDRCIGCYSCIVACKLEHDLPPIQHVHQLVTRKGQCLSA